MCNVAIVRKLTGEFIGHLAAEVSGKVDSAEKLPGEVIGRKRMGQVVSEIEMTGKVARAAVAGVVGAGTEVEVNKVIQPQGKDVSLGKDRPVHARC